MAVFSMKRPVAILAKAHPIGDIKPLIGEAAPVVLVVDRNSIASAAFQAGPIVPCHHCVSPGLVLNPVPLGLLFPGAFARIVPVRFSLGFCHEGERAFPAAEPQPPAGRAKVRDAATCANSLRDARSLVPRNLADGGGPEPTGHVRWLWGLVPCSWLAKPKVGWAKQVNASGFHPVPDTPACPAVSFPDLFRAELFRYIQTIKLFLAWRDERHFSDFSTATNTWKRVAIATW